MLIFNCSLIRIRGLHLSHFRFRCPKQTYYPSSISYAPKNTISRAPKSSSILQTPSCHVSNLDSTPPPCSCREVARSQFRNIVDSSHPWQDQNGGNLQYFPLWLVPHLSKNAVQWRFVQVWEQASHPPANAIAFHRQVYSQTAKRTPILQGIQIS